MPSSSFDIASGVRGSSLDVTGPSGGPVPLGVRHGSCLCLVIMSGAARHRNGCEASLSRRSERGRLPEVPSGMQRSEGARVSRLSHLQRRCGRKRPMNDAEMMRRTCRCGHPGWTHYARFGQQECLMPGCHCDGFLAERDGRPTPWSRRGWRKRTMNRPVRGGDHDRSRARSLDVEARGDSHFQ